MLVFVISKLSQLHDLMYTIKTALENKRFPKGTSLLQGIKVIRLQPPGSPRPMYTSFKRSMIVI